MKNDIKTLKFLVFAKLKRIEDTLNNIGNDNEYTAQEATRIIKNLKILNKQFK